MNPFRKKNGFFRKQPTETDLNFGNVFNYFHNDNPFRKKLVFEATNSKDENFSKQPIQKDEATNLKDAIQKKKVDSH